MGGSKKKSRLCKKKKEKYIKRSEQQKNLWHFNEYEVVGSCEKKENTKTSQSKKEKLNKKCCHYLLSIREQNIKLLINYKKSVCLFVNNLFFSKFL